MEFGCPLLSRWLLVESCQVLAITLLRQCRLIWRGQKMTDTLGIFPKFAGCRRMWNKLRLILTHVSQSTPRLGSKLLAISLRRSNSGHRRLRHGWCLGIVCLCKIYPSAGFGDAFAGWMKSFSFLAEVDRFPKPYLLFKGVRRHVTKKPAPSVLSSGARLVLQRKSDFKQWLKNRVVTLSPRGMPSCTRSPGRAHGCGKTMPLRLWLKMSQVIFWPFGIKLWNPWTGPRCLAFRNIRVAFMTIVNFFPRIFRQP